MTLMFQLLLGFAWGQQSAAAITHASAMWTTESQKADWLTLPQKADWTPDGQKADWTILPSQTP